MTQLNQQLLATKLHIPRPRTTLVARPRLIARLDCALEYNLTLISAPAGFGKTSVVSEWLSNLRLEASKQSTIQNPKSSIGWVSLDAGDNDPTRFWAYFIGALETIFPGIGHNSLELLHSSPKTLPIEAILTSLINCIVSILSESEAATQLIIVLDDYHFITNTSIHNAVAFLLDHLPSQMHLVITTRSDPPLPLARLRVRGQLNELRAADLRFKLDETVAFLNRIMQLNLSHKDITKLASSTEGWIAGLQLAALSMQRQEDVTGFIQAFTGNNRYILEYLAQEVLEQQPEHVRTFLLQTSILNRLSAGVCQAVTGRNDSQDLLVYLEKANLFLIPLDYEQRWYRYHALFADFLQNYLQRTGSGQVAELNQRAAYWYEQNGFLTEAIEHFLAGQATEPATHIIEGVARSVWMRGEGVTLLGWLAALPEEVVRSNARLSLFYAWALIAGNRLEAVDNRLYDAEQALRKIGIPTENLVVENREVAELWAEYYILRATMARFHEDTQPTIDFSQRALQLLPPDNLIWRSVTALNLGHAYRLKGDLKAGIQAYEESIELGRANQNNYTVLLAMANLAQLQLKSGFLHRAHDLLQQAMQVIDEHRLQHLGLVTLSYLKLGEILYEWDDLSAAAQQFTNTIESGQQSLAPNYVISGYLWLARVFQAQGQVGQALERLAKAGELAQQHNLPQLFIQIKAAAVRIQLEQQALVNQWLREADLKPDDLPSPEREFEQLTLVRVLITRNRAKEVLPWLEQWRQLAQAGERGRTLIEVLTLQALANYTLNQPKLAFIALQQALILAEPEGYHRLFVDLGTPLAYLLAGFQQWQAQQAALPAASVISESYLNKLLDAFKLNIPPVDKPAKPGQIDSLVVAKNGLNLADTLSEREVEVLRYLAAGLSNQAIATQMTVAPSTVKTHLKNIYRKLNVESRIMAVAHARELNLL